MTSFSLEKRVRPDPAPCARWRRRLLPAILILCAGTVVSCSRKPAEAGRGKAARPPVAVLTARAEAQDVPVEINAIGTVQAYSRVSVRPQITGLITEVHFEEGSEVKAGDVLFTIDPRPWEAALNQAAANLQHDRAQLISARLQFERTSNLFESKIASREDYDTAEAAYDALAAALLADSAAMTNAQVNLGYTSIRSPIDGRTGNLSLKKGNVVKAPDDVLLTITEVRPIYVAFAVPEQHLPAIRREARGRRLPVMAKAPGQADDPARGELTFIDNAVDTNTGTILLKATFANAQETLWPGQFVQVTLTLSNLVQATVVPSHAIQSGQNGEFVFAVNSDLTVKAVPVTPGVVHDGMTAVSGPLKPGDTVVVDGQLRLAPGAVVEIKNAPDAAEAKGPIPPSPPAPGSAKPES